MAFIEETIGSETVYRGMVFDVIQYTVKAVNGKEAKRDILVHNGGAVMVAVKDDGKVLMVKQFRKSMDRVMLELPAGKIDDGEDALSTAKRELTEETGYTAGEIKHLITINPSCGYTSELLSIYLCKDLKKGKQDFDDTEDLDLLEYDPDELYRLVMDGEIIDAKSVIGILFARCAGEI